MTRDVAVGSLEDLPVGKPVRFQTGELAVCLVRLEDGVRAVADTCSHEDFALSEGEVDQDERAVECWKHGSLFSLDTGAALTFPATRPVATFAVRVEDGAVVLEVPGEDGREGSSS